MPCGSSTERRAGDGAIDCGPTSRSACHPPSNAACAQPGHRPSSAKEFGRSLAESLDTGATGRTPVFWWAAAAALVVACAAAVAIGWARESPPTTVPAVGCRASIRADNERA